MTFLYYYILWTPLYEGTAARKSHAGGKDTKLHYITENSLLGLYMLGKLHGKLQLLRRFPSPPLFHVI